MAGFHCNTKEKLKTKVMQNLWDKQGVLHKRYANGNAVFEKRSLSLRFCCIKYCTPILDS